MKAVLNHPGVLQRAGLQGVVTGLDLPSVLAVAAAYGCTNAAVVAQLTGAAERGIIAGQQEVQKLDAAA